VKDVTHVFFMTWIPRPTEEEMVKVNRGLFKTIVDTVADASRNLEHLYLQTGSKYYGRVSFNPHALACCSYTNFFSFFFSFLSFPQPCIWVRRREEW
jgi:hypothetical protein